MDSTGSHKGLSDFQCISNAFQTVSFSVPFPLQAPTIMWSSLLVLAPSPEYTNHTGDELTRQAQYSSELQFAFLKSASGSIVFPEIELAHQQTLDNSLLSPPPTSLFLPSLSLSGPLITQML